MHKFNKKIYILQQYKNKQNTHMKTVIANNKKPNKTS